MGTVTRFFIANMYHFAILLLALGVSSQDSFDCGDYSYNICHDPPPAQELHVDSLEECIQNCDLFGSFDQCDYLMYYGDQGTDENCKLIADPNSSGTSEEEMQKYLDNCRVTGQPLTTDEQKVGHAVNSVLVIASLNVINVTVIKELCATTLEIPMKLLNCFLAWTHALDPSTSFKTPTHSNTWSGMLNRKNVSAIRNPTTTARFKSSEMECLWIKLMYANLTRECPSNRK